MTYLTRRIGLFLVTLWAALTVNFIIPRVMPGNEATAVLAPLSSDGAIGNGLREIAAACLQPAGIR